MSIGYGFSSQMSDPYTISEYLTDECLYCGDISTLYDHVLPLIVYRKMPNFPWPREILTLVPCCNRCNVTASNRVFISLSAKYNYVRRQRGLSV